MVMRSLQVKIPPIPMLNFNAQDALERKELSSLISYLQLVQQGAKQFVSAISLFDFCQDNEFADDWRVVAARAGAISLNEMGIGLKLLYNTRDSILCKSVGIDYEKVTAAQIYFSVSFPNAEKVRHVIAHQEFYNRTRKLDGDIKRYMDEQISFSATNNLESSISGNRWISSWEGETVGYNLSKESAERARNTCIKAFSAFYSL